jgi:hypothetical protein
MSISNLQDKLGSKSKSDDVQRQLDDAIADSFPTSDPIALAQPHDPEELGLRRSMMTPSTWLIVGGGLLAILALIALRR